MDRHKYVKIAFHGSREVRRSLAARGPRSSRQGRQAGHDVMLCLFTTICSPDNVLRFLFFQLAQVSRDVRLATYNNAATRETFDGASAPLIFLPRSRFV